MRLQDYFAAHDIDPGTFATSIGVTRQALDRYRQRKRIPKPDVMSNIFRETRGEVRPDDFYDLPALRKQRKRQAS